MNWYKYVRLYFKDSLFVNAYYIMGNTVVSAVSGFVFWIVAARFYEVEDVGLGSALMAALGFLFIFSQLGMDIGLIRYLPNESNKQELINSCYMVCMGFSLAVSLVFIITLKVWMPTFYMSNSINMFAVMIVIVLINMVGALNGLQVNVFIALRNSKYSFFQTVASISRLVLLPMLSGIGFVGICISFGFGFFMSLLVGSVLMRGLINNYMLVPRLNAGIIKKLFMYCFSNYFANILFNIPNIVLPLMVLCALGKEANALFGVSWAISTALLMVALATSRSLLAEGSHSPEEIEDKMVKTLKFVYFIIVPMVIIVFILGQKILLLFGKPYAVGAFGILKVLCVASIPYAVNVTYIAMKRLQKEIRFVNLVSGFIAGFTLLCGKLLVDKLGLEGVAISWLIGNGIVALAIIAFYVRKMIIPKKIVRMI